MAIFYLNLHILEGIAQYVREHRPWTIYLYATEAQENLPGWLARWEGDGIIGRIVDPETYKLIKTLHIPFVDVRGQFRDRDIPLVHGDDHAIGRAAAEHLLDRGFRQFGFFSVQDTIQTRHRKEAFLATLQAAGGQCDCYERTQAPLLTGPDDWSQAEADLARWLSSLPSPAAVMAMDNACGQAVLSAARRVGIRVPDELAVIGVGHEAAICEVCDPPLSSVVRDYKQQGYEAAALLGRMMAGEAPPTEPILIPPAGVVTRQSTDVLAIDDPFVVQAVNFIRRYACEGIGVTDVLREVPLSRTVLQERFRRVMGQTVGDAIIAARVKRACQLLAETQMPLRHIAEIAGFGHQQYMGAVFRKRLRTTPARYRKSHRAAR